MTEAERKLWRRLRESPPPGTHFRRQATIGPYFADFACHTTRLVIEVDGGGHGSSAQAGYDARRNDYLESRVYRVMRFWNNDVLGNVDGVMSMIQAAVVSTAPKPPTPDPSPPSASLTGGGEDRRGAAAEYEA